MTASVMESISRRMSAFLQTSVRRSAARRLSHRNARVFRRLAPGDIAIDCGANVGDVSAPMASRGAQVYAFEPNIKAASKIIGKLPNFVVIPMAIATENGFEIFHENAYEESSSLLPMDEEVRKVWVGGKELQVVNEYFVPTIRLDTFMDIMGIPRVDFLKIDTQGFDYDVVVSCGDRLTDIGRIQLEVTVTSRQFYQGAKGKQEIVRFLTSRDFSLVEVEKQTYGAEENLLFVRVEK